MIALVLLASLSAASAAVRDCSRPSGGPYVLMQDHPFEQSRERMAALFQELLDSGKRLEYRGWLENDRWVMPYAESNRAGQTSFDFHAELPVPLAGAIVTHMSEAFSRGWSIYPFRSDFGHGHLMLPEPAYAALAPGTKKETLERILSHPELEILYHVSEQLKFYEGTEPVPGTVFLREHRNVVGTLRAPKDIRVLPVTDGRGAGAPAGMIMAGGVIYLSASRAGCLPFEWRGQTLHLDLSLVPPSQPERRLEERESED